MSEDSGFSNSFSDAISGFASDIGAALGDLADNMVSAFDGNGRDVCVPPPAPQPVMAARNDLMTSYFDQPLWKTHSF